MQELFINFILQLSSLLRTNQCLMILILRFQRWQFSKLNAQGKLRSIAFTLCTSSLTAVAMQLPC